MDILLLYQTMVLPQNSFKFGDIVQVQARTGPGMNQLGGVAEIVNVHGPNKVVTTTRYDVRYVLNRRQREQYLEACYISVPSFAIASAKSADNTKTLTITSIVTTQQNRRSCPTPGLAIPSSLRAALLADGCDVDGIATRKALEQYNNQQYQKSCISDGKENSNNQIRTSEMKGHGKTIQQSAALKRKDQTKSTVFSAARKAVPPATKQYKVSNESVVAVRDDFPTWDNATKCQFGCK
jgi:hypothetical protein